MRTGTCTPAPCRITQRGWDGFGHQLDGKLTCIAAAAALSIEYVHVPFKRVKVRRGAKPVHWDDATELEDFIESFLEQQENMRWSLFAGIARHSDT